jgi:uncharacterized repeat protein (TIGR01451 family)
MLGAWLLLETGKLYGQREIIATATVVPPETSAAPTSPTYVSVSPSQTIQPVSFSSDASAPTEQRNAPRSPAPQKNEAVNQPTSSAPMLPPTVLLNGMTTHASPMTSVVSPAGTKAGETPAPPGLGRTSETQAPPAGTRTGETPIPGATLSLEVLGPDRLLLGQPLAHEIVIRNTGVRTIADIHVEEPLPTGVRVIKADPPAVKHDNRLIWDLRSLEGGGARHLKVELSPVYPGELELRPFVTFVTSNGLRTQVSRPPFSLEIRADRAQVTRGERIRFRIHLANYGDAPIRNIKIYDTLPSGLHHPNGPKIGVENFGDLLPGQTRDLPLETTAVESGTFHHEVFAQADHGIEAKGAVEIVITEPSLSLRLDGPAKTVTQHEVDFHLEVANPAVLTAKNVRLVQALPPTFEVVSASGASFDANQHALVWSLTDLGAGQRQRLTFRIKVHDGGDWLMTAAVLSQNFPEAIVKHTLHADAAALLKLEVSSREERLSVGEETVFRMHVFNKGDASCAGVQLTATLPEPLVPIKAAGPSKEQIEKQQVRFAPLARLDAHGDVVYCIHARGQQPGKGAFQVELTADKQMTITREISVQVRTTEATVGNSKPLSGEMLR